MNVNETGRYIVHLILSLFNSRIPDEKPENISFEDIFQMSARHNVCVMTLAAIDKLKHKPDENLYKKWDQKRTAAIAQGIVQLNERDRIYRNFEEKKISYIPLKGCLLKEMYPRNEYREMSDLDILIQECDQAKARDIMESIGYITENYQEKKDDSYRKDPFMHVEIHHQLLEEVSIDRLNIKDDFLLNPFCHARRDENQYRYSFTWEDFYIYLIVHNAKHYILKGIGIRQLLDIAVLKSSYNLNNSYIDQRLESIGLKSFKEQSEQLLSAWEKGIPVTGKLEEMEAIIFTSGSYGSSESRIRNQMRKASENGDYSVGRYLSYRLFPPFRMMKASYPILKKLPVLLPVFWIYRIIAKGLPSIGRYFSEMEKIKHIKKR